MTWVRNGDESVSHPSLLLVRSFDPDPLIIPAVFGFMVSCACLSSAHTTDYVINEGQAWMVGGQATQRLLDVCLKVGLLTAVQVNGIPHYRILDDPKFIHILLKSEVEANAGRERPPARVEAIVRKRDGDQCRYCGIVTFFNTKDRKSARVSQIDHRIPLADDGETVEENLVVACLHCNSSRGAARPSFDKQHPLWPVPSEPFYSANTTAFLFKHLGVKLHESSARSVSDDLEPVRPGIQPDTATSDPIGAALPKDSKTEIKLVSAGFEGAGSGIAGSGRVGSGRAEQGRAGSGRAPRSRRGRRSGKPNSSQSA